VLLARRSLLRLLALSPLLGAAGATSSAGASRLSPASRRLAALGRRLSESDPAAAEALYRFAALRVSATAIAGAADDVCAPLLAKAHVAAELRQGLVHRLDGWLLSRSEAGACVYLHRLEQTLPGR
jgi:hypothetical protein